MKKGKKYKLVSFNGTIKSDETCDPNENYWALIGHSGTLINFAQELNFNNQNRVLFKFDQEIIKFGLESHNSEPNSLWILKTDLESI